MGVKWGYTFTSAPHININCNLSQKENYVLLLVCMCECGHLLCSSAVAEHGVAWSCVYLSHGCQEALWVEEACHPEAVGTPFKDPSPELPVPIEQFCEPEAQSAGDPRSLQNQKQLGSLDKKMTAPQEDHRELKDRKERNHNYEVQFQFP